MDFHGCWVVKNTPTNAGKEGLIPESVRSPREGNGNPLQYSCLENSMNKGTWCATVHGVNNRVGHNLGTKKQQNNFYWKSSWFYLKNTDYILKYNLFLILICYFWFWYLIYKKMYQTDICTVSLDNSGLGSLLITFLFFLRFKKFTLMISKRNTLKI